MIKRYIKLLRVKHYIKNLLIFVPLFFSGKLYDMERLKYGFFGFIVFSLISSAVYILNDYKDIEKDRKHPVKKERPLASGCISKKAGLFIMFLCIISAVGVCTVSYTHLRAHETF